MARDRGLAALTAPIPPGRVLVEAPVDTAPIYEPPAPVGRRGLAGIVVGWSGVGASLGSFALMATCSALIRRAKDQIDHDQLTDAVSEEVAGALDDGARTCRSIYAVFGATAAGVGVLGLSIGYARRHHERPGDSARWQLGPWLDRRGAQLGLSAEF